MIWMNNHMYWVSSHSVLLRYRILRSLYCSGKKIGIMQHNNGSTLQFLGLLTSVLALILKSGNAPILSFVLHHSHSCPSNNAPASAQLTLSNWITLPPRNRWKKFFLEQSFSVFWTLWRLGTLFAPNFDVVDECQLVRHRVKVGIKLMSVPPHDAAVLSSWLFGARFGTKIGLWEKY